MVGPGSGTVVGPNSSLLPHSAASPGSVTNTAIPPLQLPLVGTEAATATTTATLPGAAAGLGVGAVPSTVGAAVAAESAAVAGGVPSPRLVEALRREWEAESKALIAAQMVSDMRSDKTVEYIRSLEEQVAR